MSVWPWNDPKSLDFCRFGTFKALACRTRQLAQPPKPLFPVTFGLSLFLAIGYHTNVPISSSRPFA